MWHIFRIGREWRIALEAPQGVRIVKTFETLKQARDFVDLAECK